MEKVGRDKGLGKSRSIGDAKDKLSCVPWSVFLMIGSVWVYYKSILGIPAGVVVGIYAFRQRYKRVKIRNKQKILIQFKNMIIAMQSVLEAGKSMENAIIMAGQEISPMYGEDAKIVKEIKLLEKKLNLSISFEKALKDFAENLDIEEIYDFVDVISTIKRTGGNAIKVIKDTVEKIVGEIELREELEVIVAAKKLEQQIMVFMPSLILLFLRLTNRDFLSPLYGGITGTLIMTIALSVNLAADYLGKRIVEIN